jgi:hypothetical protein
MTTHARTTRYRYRIADLDGAVHELILSRAGIVGEAMFPHEQAERWRYELRTGGVTVFTGKDLTTPLDTSPDKVAASALFFLTVQPDDTDAGYFSRHTSEQLAWCEEHASSLSAAIEALQEAPAGLGACRIGRLAAQAPDRRWLRSGDLTRALHMIAPGVPVRTQAADRNLFRIRMREADAARLYLIGMTGSPPAWDRVSAWLSALVDIPVDVTAADVTEDLGSGERWAFITVRPSGCVDADLVSAVRTDHPCEDRSCEIAVALEQGYPQVAASMLLGATDAPAVETLIETGRAIVPASLERCRGWGEWLAYHSRFGLRCAACGSYTYGGEDEPPAACGECRQPFDGRDRPALTGDETAAAWRINQAMEGEAWESRDAATWTAPRQLVPDPVSGLGNLGLRLPGAADSELGGESPYRSALAALDAYAHAAAANAQAAELLEAQLTVHGFDRHQALMSHVAGLRDAAELLRAHAREARIGLFMRHAVGEEYHASGWSAAAAAFRNGAAWPTQQLARTEERMA